MARFPDVDEPDWDWWRELWPDPVAVLEDLGVEPGMSVADVGCATGSLTLPVAEYVDGPVYAVADDAEHLMDLAERADAVGLTNVRGRAGDALALPELLPERVDTVLLSNVLHGVRHPEELAAAAREALTSGGRLVVVEWHDDPREETTVDGEPRGPPTELRVPPETVRRIAIGAGFDTTVRVELQPYHYAYSCI